MSKPSLLLVLFFLIFSAPVRAIQVTGVRLMLHPDALALAHLEQLSERTGLSLIDNAKITAQGVLELTLPTPLAATEMTKTLAALRGDRAILWAEPMLSNEPGDRVAMASATERGRELIIKLKPNTKKAADLWKSFQQKSRTDRELKLLRTLDSHTAIMQMPESLSERELLQEALKLQEEYSEIEWAEPNSTFYPHATANDTFFPFQWNLRAIKAPTAWDSSTGMGITIAVLDSGHVPEHLDMPVALPGVDTVTDIESANDGDGRDLDARDPGDFFLPFECNTRNPFFFASSWHGTHVSGTAIALTHNDMGIAGVAYGARHLPVRVLGKCGGTIEDIAAGIRWAAGLAVAGLPNNPNPAQVINMSLGGFGACPNLLQSAINDALARGSSVVVSAGNDAQDVAFTSPANCNGVISVAASSIGNNLAFYSNFGLGIKVTAPGGEGLNALDSVFAPISDGVTGAMSFTTYGGYQGTSMAAPHVAGTIALMLERNRNLSPGQVLNILQRTAQPLTTGACTLTLSDTINNSTTVVPLCGAGLIDASAAVRQATTP